MVVGGDDRVDEGCWCTVVRTYMLADMRTTLVIDDALLRAARQRAAQRDMTLSEVVSEALRELIGGRRVPARRIRLPTYGDRKNRRRVSPAEIGRVLETDGG